MNSKNVDYGKASTGGAAMQAPQGESYGHDEVSKAFAPESNIRKMKYQDELVASDDDEGDYELKDVAEREYDEIDAPSTGNLREIHITPLDSGFVVTVGCQKVAVESVETLLSNLTDYLNNPKMYERKWYKTKGMNKLQKN